ncbi:unnamed protein product [Cuscuta epithymum]|uniref:Uncharacterized protein n=1 Tax=Cuscuta epithymum TaxID=186058 RepID=A0AAV0ESA3_9ASTE|nr:unnamed protein product [Cuscuta epithymum]
MGTCASSHILGWQSGRFLLNNTPAAAAAMVVHENGELLECRRPVKAADVLSENPNCFLSNSESMSVDSEIPQVSKDEDLQIGQLYFLLPISKSHSPLTLQDMCRLAVKASSALNGYFTPVAGAVVRRRRGSCNERVSRRRHVATFITDWAVTVVTKF